jgi:hypothetical protein
MNRPTSTVNPLPAVEDTTSFTVSWGGSDGSGSGIWFYDIVYSDDGGPYQTWQSMTTQTSAVFNGQAGHTYSFYSVAYSYTGFLQQVPKSPQATTTVSSSSGGHSPSPTTPSPTTPSPTPPPTIVGEEVLFSRNLNKHHKPVGKPILSGFKIRFSSAMNPARAGNAANYQVDWTSTKRVGKKLKTMLHPVPISVQYDDATHSVSLLLRGKQAFANGGEITVIATPPDGVSDASGLPLDGGGIGTAGDDGVLTILKKAKGISGP